MSAIISWNGKKILKTSSGVISSLCNCVDYVIYKNNLFFNDDVTSLLDRWYITSGGIGFDVADYIHKKEDMLSLQI